MGASDRLTRVLDWRDVVKTWFFLRFSVFFCGFFCYGIVPQGNNVDEELSGVGVWSVWDRERVAGVVFMEVVGACRQGASTKRRTVPWVDMNEGLSFTGGRGGGGNRHRRAARRAASIVPPSHVCLRCAAVAPVTSIAAAPHLTFTPASNNGTRHATRQARKRGR